MNEFDNKISENREGGISKPRKKTIDFLTQFARAYHAEPALGEQIGGFVMN